MVAAAAKQAKPGEWILGRGWHQEKWSSVPKPNVEGFPFHDALSKVSPNNPVMLTHASGHASFVNAKAMEAAGLTAQDAESGGRRDPEGRHRAADRAAPRNRIGHRRPRARGVAIEEDRGGARRRCASSRSIWRSRPASKRASRRSRMPASTFTTDRHLQAGGRRRPARHPPVGDGARQQREPRCEDGAVQGGWPQQQPPDDRRDQGHRRRRARLARRADAGAVHRTRRRASVCRPTRWRALR